MAKERDEPSSGDSSVPLTERAKSPAAQRALAEAKLRRKEADADALSSPREVNGREGLDPVRYGDWENKGIASDF